MFFLGYSFACATVQEAKKTEHFKWQLFHVKKDIEEYAESKAVHREKLAELVAQRAADSQKLGNVDAELARLRKQRLSLNRDLEKLQADSAKQVSVPIHSSGNMSAMD